MAFYACIADNPAGLWFATSDLLLGAQRPIASSKRGWSKSSTYCGCLFCNDIPLSQRVKPSTASISSLAFGASRCIQPLFAPCNSLIMFLFEQPWPPSKGSAWFSDSPRPIDEPCMRGLYHSISAFASSGASRRIKSLAMYSLSFVEVAPPQSMGFASSNRASADR